MIDKVKYKGKYELKTNLYKIFTKELITDLYINQKLSESDICKKYEISSYFIRSILKMYNIPIRTVSERNKLSVRKSNETCMKHFGVKRPLMNKDILRKSQNTLFEHYGVSCNAYSENWRSKFKETSIRKYGTEFPQQSDEIKQKMKDTCLSKYGVEYVTKTEIMKTKTKETCLRKYGFESCMRNPRIKEKAKEACLQKYGVESIFQSHGCRQHSHSKYEYKDKKFDSAPELAYYIWLLDNNVKFEYQPNIKFEYIVDDKKHYYFPDFKVENDLIEIKGDYFFDGDILIDPYNRNNDNIARAKQKIMLENKVIILKEKDYKKYLDYIDNKYGKNFLSSLRCKKK